MLVSKAPDTRCYVPHSTPKLDKPCTRYVLMAPNVRPSTDVTFRSKQDVLIYWRLSGLSQPDPGSNLIPPPAVWLIRKAATSPARRSGSLRVAHLAMDWVQSRADLKHELQWFLKSTRQN